MKRKMCRVIKTMYNSSGSALLQGEKSSTFSVEQRAARGCSYLQSYFQCSSVIYYIEGN